MREVSFSPEFVFPAGAGVNRLRPSTHDTRYRIPRRRGGEPFESVILESNGTVFPAGAGVNRS